MNIPKKSVFIGGTGRCGTSLLRKIFSHDKKVISLPFAASLFIEIDGIISIIKSFESHKTPYDEKLLLERFSNFYFQLGVKNGNYVIEKYDFEQNLKNFVHPYKDWELTKYIEDYYGIFQKFKKKLNIVTYKGNYSRDESKNSNINFINKKKENIIESFRYLVLLLINGIKKKQLKKKDKYIYLDDNTWNYLNFLELKKIFPNAYLIHIFRDPRDVILSLSKQRWSPILLKDCVIFYKKLMDQWFIEKKQMNKKIITEVSFEKLVKNPEFELKKISKFINFNFSFNIDLIDFKKSNIGSWRNEFNRSQIKFLNKELEEYLMKYRYIS